MYCSEERYIFPTKWEMFKLKLLSRLGSKKAKQDLYYINLDIYYWFLWQQQQKKIIDNLSSITSDIYGKKLVNWIMED
jgi:hypothetical protein